MKLTRLVLMLAALLLLSSGAKADQFLYTYQSADFDWTAVLPVAPDLLTPEPGQPFTPVNITSFLTFSINPASFIAADGCTAPTSASLYAAFNPQTQNQVTTEFAGPNGPLSCGESGSTFDAVIGTGTFIFYAGNGGPPLATLTVTDLTTAVPEPSSVLLLGMGSLPVLGLARRRRRSFFL